MASALEALITRSENASDILELLPDVAEAVPLELGLILVPITKALKAAIGDEKTRHLGFDQLTSSLATIAQTGSDQSPVMYCHLEFFGGVGFQASVIWGRGSVQFGPVFTANHPSEQLTPAYQVVERQDQPQGMAINVALRHLGVRATEPFDEFETVGLGRHRGTDDWLPPAA